MAAREPPPVSVICTQPLMLLWRGAFGEEACATLQSMCARAQTTGRLEATDDQWTPTERRLLHELEAMIGALTGQPPHADELPLLPLVTNPASPYPTEDTAHTEQPLFPLGLHVDTNGGCPRRFASALLYLTTPAGGGHTCFPLAEAEAASAALDASRRLIDARASHTGQAGAKLQPFAQAIVRAAEAGAGTSVRPERGSLLVFWTRGDDGAVCPYSWHGARRVEGVAHGGSAASSETPPPKVLLRKFKELPIRLWPREQSAHPSARAADVPRAVAEFVRDSRRGFALAAPHAAIPCWPYALIDQLACRGGARCAATWPVLARPYRGARKRARSASGDESGAQGASGAVQGASAPLVENEPGLCAAMARVHAQVLASGAYSRGSPEPCACGATAPTGIGALLLAAAAPAVGNGCAAAAGDAEPVQTPSAAAHGGALVELGELDTAELECALRRGAAVRHAAEQCSTRACFGERWVFPPRSACVLASMCHWGPALRRVRPRGGYPLVVVDPPWPSHSAHRAGAYETMPDVCAQLLAHVPMRELVRADGGLVAVWTTNKRAWGEWVVSELFPRWGVEHVATWFWLKVGADGGGLATGPVDSAHRKPWEPLFIGAAPRAVGGPERAAPPARRVLVGAPVGHSIKPVLADELAPYTPAPQRAAEAGDVLGLELFAREMHAGWHSAGDQALLYQNEAWFCRGRGRALERDGEVPQR